MVMALSDAKLQALLDDLDEAAASPELEVQGSDGKRVKFSSLEEIQRRRAYLVSLMGGGSKKARRPTYVRFPRD